MADALHVDTIGLSGLGGLSHDGGLHSVHCLLEEALWLLLVVLLGLIGGWLAFRFRAHLA